MIFPNPFQSVRQSPRLKTDGIATTIKWISSDGLRKIQAVIFFEKLNLSANKAEKDIGIYKSSISKMEQAKELIEELRINDKKKTTKK